MATDSLRIFGCPTCGFRVHESEPSCPRCNNAFSKSTKLECPFCGEFVDPRSTSCPSCHVNYSEFRAKSKKRANDSSIDELLTEIIKLESSQIKHEEKRFSCPTCSWMLDGSETSCPKCGKDLSSDYAFQCPICGEPVASDAISCPECGAKFEDGHETEPAHLEGLPRVASAQIPPPPPMPPSPQPQPDLPPPFPEPRLKPEREESAQGPQTPPPPVSPEPEIEDPAGDPLLAELESLGQLIHHNKTARKTSRKRKLKARTSKLT